MKIVDFEDVKYNVIVTVIYLFLYFIYMFMAVYNKEVVLYQIKQKRINDFMEGDQIKTNHKILLEIKGHPDVIKTEQAQQSMLQQMPAFLITFWLYSLWIDATWGASLGLLYTFLRSFYWYLNMIPSDVSSHQLILLIGGPNCLIILYFTLSLLLKALH